MAISNKIGEQGYNFYTPHPGKKGVEEGQINQLPSEILEKVLFHLNATDMQSTAAASHLLKRAAINTSKHLIQVFSNFLCKNLKKPHVIKIEKLFSTESYSKILDSVNLIEVKFSFFGLRKNILNILKDLTDDDLNNLENLSKNEVNSIFFENLFDLARIYKRLDEANTISNEDWRETALKKITSALKKITKDLIKCGNFVKAIEVANTIPDVCVRARALEEIFWALIQSYNIDTVIAAANTIPRKDEIVHVLSCIQKTLIQSGNFVKAIEVEVVLIEIFKSLIQTDNINDAKGIACSIFNRDTRALALKGLCKALIQSRNIDKALEVASWIRSQSTRIDALKKICKRLIQSGNFEKTIEAAYATYTTYTRREEYSAPGDIGNALIQICKALIQSGDFDKAIEVANTIPDQKKRGCALEQISVALYQNNNIDKAIEVANMILPEDKEEDFLAVEEAFLALWRFLRHSKDS